jgi:hypothetical protein
MMFMLEVAGGILIAFFVLGALASWIEERDRFG